MAVVYTGTRNLIAASQLPTGYVRPVVAANTKEYTFNLSLSVLKVTVDESTASDTMTAIFENATIGLDKQILDLITADYDNTQTVVGFGECNILTTNLRGITGSDDWLTDAVVNYLATVEVFVSVT